MMKRQNKLYSYLFILLFSFLVIQAAAARDNLEEPRLKAEPWAYSFSEKLDNTDWRELFSLAYYVSGGLDDYQTAVDAFESYIIELGAEVVSMDDRVKAERVLEFMHRNFLKRYSVYQTRLDTLLNTGQYNCLSSAMLYAILSAAAGLDVSGVGTSDHAFCSVKVDGEQIDVETTNIHGFDPGTKTDFYDAFGKTTGYVYVPPKNYRGRNQLNLLNLFSLTLSNRMSYAESKGRFPEAVGLSVDRWVLLGSVPGQPFNDLIDRMLNHGAALAKAGNEEAALEWAERAVSVYGPHSKWDDFVDSVSNNLLVKFLRSGDVAEARLRFEILRPRLTANAVADLDNTISETEIITALNAVEPGSDDSDFYNVLDNAEKAGVVKPARLREFEESRIMSEIDYISKTEGWEAAYLAADTAVTTFGTSRKLENVRRISRKNHIAELYNEAASAFNEERYNEAYIITTEALLSFPDEKSFATLLKWIKQKQNE